MTTSLRKHLKFKVTIDNALTAGVTPDVLTAIVTDGNKNPVVGATVNLTAKNGATIDFTVKINRSIYFVQKDRNQLIADEIRLSWRS
jgi:phosphoheptose isomerase